MNCPQTNQRGTQQEIDAAWEAFVAGRVEAAFGILAPLNGYPPWLPLPPVTKEVAECLLSYDFPALQQTTETAKHAFALAVARKWLFSEFPVTRTWDPADEPLATILGTSYVLDVDVETMSREVYGEEGHTYENMLPAAYAQRAKLWPELVSLPTLSLAARKIFLCAVKCTQIRSGLIEYSRLVDCVSNTPELDGRLAELVQAGLIDLDPSTTDLMMSLGLKDLKQFAFDHGVAPHGSKHRLIQAIVTQIGQEEIGYLNSLIPDIRYVRLLVSNLPLLKKHVWTERNRIELYLEWIRRVHCLGFPPLSRYRQAPPDHDDMFRPEPIRHRRTKTEIQLADEIWDSKCDQIVRDLTDKYAWDAHSHITEAIVAYLPPDKLAAFKQACEDRKTRSWSSVLAYHGLARQKQMRLRVRNPRLLECAGCGKQFLESSVRSGLAERVGYKICFCHDCYSKVFWPNDYGVGPMSMSQDDMLNRLARLATALESVPLATFVKQPDLATASEEKQIAVMKSLLAMPSYITYVETFGSWLKALILAGVLESGTQPSERGTRCIAADGHECFSLAERLIDDWLSAHDIPHEKEPLYPYHFYLNPSGRMRADWRVGETLVEYAGLMDEPEYAAKMECKQELATELGFPLLLILPQDISSLDETLGRLVDPRSD